MKLPAYGTRPRTPHTPAPRYGAGPWMAIRRAKEIRPPRVSLRRAGGLAPRRELVQGQRASDLEARVYRALKALGWSDRSINFQYSIRGGRVPGGQVIDFLVRGFGRNIVIFVNGDYWHTRSEMLRQKTLEQQAQVAETLRQPFQLLVLASGDLVDDEMAYRRLLIQVGRGY